MVSHHNLMSNLESIRRGFRIDFQDQVAEPECGVFWLPFFHDMGLIGGLLEPLYLGGRTILMSPRSFLQRPVRWLKCISDYGAVISGAPNFAYQLCVDRISPEQTESIDLQRWRIAFSGAEPILPRTLRAFGNRFSSCGFSSSAFYPCYGLAESTLLAAGGDGPAEPTILAVARDSLADGTPQVVDATVQREAHKLVSCGRAVHDAEIALVDPQTCRRVEERVVGEIWLRGGSVSRGYWNCEAENQVCFNAQIQGGQAGYYRTGDLGFLHDGQLYVTGRMKDVIILRGRNLFPQDIEATVRETLGSDAGQCAAFAVDGARGEVLAIVAELPRRMDAAALPECVRSIRRSVIDGHEVDPRHVYLVRQATVPLTSSGKVQRSRCRELFDADEIKTKYRYSRAGLGDQSPLQIPALPRERSSQNRQPMCEAIEAWMTEWLILRGGVDPGDIDLEKPFAEYGLDSMSAVELSGEIEDWSGIELTPVVAWNHPTVSRMSSYLVDRLFADVHSAPPETEVSEAELENLLDEIEQLSDDEIDHALAEKRSP
jgi:acyl-CoA synthetase (AMP-forming)/AMP-acid ligase II/acyl carrier protein